MARLQSATRFLTVFVCAALFNVGLGIESNCRSQVLKRGMNGACVKRLQELLTAEENIYDVTVNGDFKSRTEVAVKRVQFDHGLTIDGIVEANTWSALLGESNVAATETNEISTNCLLCICEVESNCQPLPCAWDDDGVSCGYYQIKHIYYKDCVNSLDAPEDEWKSCALDQACSIKCIKNYMNRYAAELDQTCETYARLHNGGPTGPWSTGTKGYWSKMQKCCDRVGQC